MVRRRVRSSTVPAREASLTWSPTLYWFSTRMKMPLSTSLKRDWAARARPMPATPAEASRGVRLTWKTERTWSRTMNQMMAYAEALRMLATVRSSEARWGLAAAWRSARRRKRLTKKRTMRRRTKA